MTYILYKKDKSKKYIYKKNLSESKRKKFNHSAKDNNNAVPLFVHVFEVTLPDFRSTLMMNEGLSRVPVRIGYMYNGAL